MSLAELPLVVADRLGRYHCPKCGKLTGLNYRTGDEYEMTVNCYVHGIVGRWK